MTAARSAGILLWRRREASAPEVFIAHMGGPFWGRRDAAAWSIPKGEYGDDELPLHAALREFAEEVGVAAPDLEYELLTELRQRSGKVVTVFAARFEGPISWRSSSEFSMEWPPKSGRMQSFPEIDRAEWCSVDVARQRLVAGQVAALDALAAK